MKIRVTILSIAVALASLASVAQVSAQSLPYVPWRFGANLGLNYNLAGVGYANWVNDPARPFGQYIPKVINDGSGLGLYGGLFAEYRSRTWWGIQLRASYDMRNLTTKDDQSYLKPGGGYYSDQYKFNNSYIAVEPRLLIYPITDNGFHISVGPGLAIKSAATFDYTPEGGMARTGMDIPNVSGVTYNATLGLGYDIYLSQPSEESQWIFSPFVEGTWLMNQRGVDFPNLQGSLDDALSTVTIRAGIGIKFGKNEDANKVSSENRFFRVTPPEDGIYSKSVIEEFYPMLPYVFFDRNNTAIPSRYVLVSSGETADFMKMKGFDAADLANREAQAYRTGEIYLNVLNIFGARMRANQSVTVELVGSDPIEKNGDVLAESVKKYLVDVWQIDPARITTKGQINPRIVSGTARTPQEDRPLVDLENRRVEFVFSDPDLARRVHVKAIRDASIENNILIELTTNESIESWSVRLTGNGQNVSYGPYSSDEALLASTGLLGTAERAEFRAEVTARTADGRTLTDAVPFELFRARNDARGERYQLLFDYGEEDPVARTTPFVRDEIAPRIKAGSRVFVHGHTDNIGRPEVNQKLSEQRAKQTKTILAAALRAAGRTARIASTGRGESPDDAPMSNDQPEGRMYNRTVIMDVLPK